MEHVSERQVALATGLPTATVRRAMAARGGRARGSRHEARVPGPACSCSSSHRTALAFAPPGGGAGDEPDRHGRRRHGRRSRRQTTSSRARRSRSPWHPRLRRDRAGARALVPLGLARVVPGARLPVARADRSATGDRPQPGRAEQAGARGAGARDDRRSGSAGRRFCTSDGPATFTALQDDTPVRATWSIAPPSAGAEPPARVEPADGEETKVTASRVGPVTVRATVAGDSRGGARRPPSRRPHAAAACR